MMLDLESGRVRDVNPYLCNMLGFSRDQIVGKTIGELSPFRDVVFEILGQVALTGEPIRFEKEAEVMDRRFRVSAFRVGDSASRNIAVLFTDTTARKAEEQTASQLRSRLEMQVAERTSQLKTAVEELEAFSYSVAHNLRAPLRHLAGFVKLLQKDAGPSLSATSLQHLATISESARRMGDSINGLLKFSHVGRVAIHMEDLNLDHMVRETVDDFQLELKERQVVWVIHPLPTVRADSVLMRIVLVNLISNAVKFTGRRAEAKIEIGCAPGNKNETVFFVRDNGAGFDPRHAHKLFGVFQRLHGSAEFEGTGIGLADVQRIISRHGGRVWAEGAVDGGAAFYFSIPKKAKGKRKASPTRSKFTRPGRRKA